MPELILGLFNVFAPIVKQIIDDHSAAHDGELPTDEEMDAAFQANITKYMAEGNLWTKTHPTS